MQALPLKNSFLQCCSWEPSQSPACIADLNSQSPSLPIFLGSSLSKFLLVYSLIVDNDKISCIYKTLTQYGFFLTETCFVHSIHLMLLSIKNTFLQLSSLNWVYENITNSWVFFYKETQLVTSFQIIPSTLIEQSKCWTDFDIKVKITSLFLNYANTTTDSVDVFCSVFSWWDFALMEKMLIWNFY